MMHSSAAGCNDEHLGTRSDPSGGPRIQPVADAMPSSWAPFRALKRGKGERAALSRTSLGKPRAAGPAASVKGRQQAWHVQLEHSAVTLALVFLGDSLGNRYRAARWSTIL
jgi:hypothetical protein